MNASLCSLVVQMGIMMGIKASMGSVVLARVSLRSESGCNAALASALRTRRRTCRAESIDKVSVDDEDDEVLETADAPKM